MARLITRFCDRKRLLLRGVSAATTASFSQSPHLHSRHFCAEVVRGSQERGDPSRHPSRSKGPKGLPLPKGVLSYQHLYGSSEGEDSDSALRRRPVVLVHGMFGQKSNLRSLANKLGGHCILVDLRNHGDSFHSDSMDLNDMAEDIFETLDYLDIDTCHLVGHSLGGRAAMIAALGDEMNRSRLQSCFILDVAPADYGGYRVNLYKQMIRAFLDLPLEESALVKEILNHAPDLDVDSRLLSSEHGIRSQLLSRVMEPKLPDLSQFELSFLMANLVRMQSDDRESAVLLDSAASDHKKSVIKNWKWKCNLQSLQSNLYAIQEFDKHVKHSRDGNPHFNDSPNIHFIGGTESKYIRKPEHFAKIEEYFPKSSLTMIEGASHMIHIDSTLRCMEIILDGIHKAEEV